MANVTLLLTNGTGNYLRVEQDKADPSNTLYLGDKNEIFLNNGTADYLLADDLSFSKGFCQISCNEIIVLDYSCLKKIDRSTGNVSKFSGECRNPTNLDLKLPTEVVIDKMNRSQLLVADSKTVKSVELATGKVGNIAKMAQTMVSERWIFWGLAQTENGDIYLVNGVAIFKAGYFSGSIVLVAGSPLLLSGSTDGSLAESTFGGMFDIELITPHAVLVADYGSKRIRLVDFIADEVTSIDFCPGLPSDCVPYSLSMAYDTLYIGTNDILILPCK